MKNNTHSPLGWIDQELSSLERQGLRRRLPIRIGRQTVRMTMDGQELASFGSNDYLALAADPRLTAAAVAAAERDGWGSGASPLVCGHSQVHERLEERLAEFEATEAALVFATGFAANAGTIAALVGPGDAVFSDRQNHASLLDGCRLSRADVRVYPHGDFVRLGQLLARASGARRRLIVSDSLFSMDGELAPLGELADLAERHGSMLMIDEAHATGVLGTHGRGVAEHLGVEGRVHVRVGTLSKALGSMGGFVAGSRSLIDWLVNRARSYVFSTAPPSAAAAAAMAALDIVAKEPHRRTELLARANSLRKRLAEQGWNMGDSASQIIPVIVGEPEQAVALGAALRERGFFVPAVRPPTVPLGTGRLRISVGYAHSQDLVDRLAGAMEELAHEGAGPSLAR